MEATTQGQSGKKLKILFVDNSRTTRAVMTMVLSNQGYEVIAAANGQEAIEKVKTEPFDVVLMDLYMPFMNGHEAAKIIRELPDPCKDIPMIALTASNDPRDIDIAKASGMNEYVVKSEDHKDLFEALEKYKEKLLSQTASPATPPSSTSTQSPL